MATVARAVTVTQDGNVTVNQDGKPRYEARSPRIGRADPTVYFRTNVVTFPDAEDRLPGSWPQSIFPLFKTIRFFIIFLCFFGLFKLFFFF